MVIFECSKVSSLAYIIPPKYFASKKDSKLSFWTASKNISTEQLDQAKSIWRARNLAGVNDTARPLDKIKKILENYRDNYLADSTNFPGGCIFINFAIELNDQQPTLAEAVNDGLVKLKKMLKRFLDEEYESGTLKDDVDTRKVVEVIYSGLLGACVVYTSEKSTAGLNLTINSLTEYLDQLCK